MTSEAVRGTRGGRTAGKDRQRGTDPRRRHRAQRHGISVDRSNSLRRCGRRRPLRAMAREWISSSFVAVILGAHSEHAMNGRPRTYLPGSRAVVRVPLTTLSRFVGVGRTKHRVRAPFHRPLPLRSTRRRTSIVAALGTCLAYGLLLAAPVHALDSNTRLTQYSHTSWRMQDGSAPSGMYSIAQTADGFLWFLSSRGEIFRFDGVEFRPWRKPADVESIGRIRNLVGDQGGGLWALGARGIAHLKDGVVTRHIALDGLMPNPQNVSIDADGSIWVVRGANGISEPLCHVTEAHSPVLRKGRWNPHHPPGCSVGRRKRRFLARRADRPCALA